MYFSITYTKIKILTIYVIPLDTVITSHIRNDKNFLTPTALKNFLFQIDFMIKFIMSIT
jgi:hypothetical protein